MKIEDIYLILFVSILPYIFASDFFKRKIKSRLFSKLLLNCDFFFFIYNQRAKGPNRNQISKQQKLQTRRWLIKHHKIYLNVMHSIIQSISTHIGFLVYMNYTSPIEIPHQFSNSYNKPPAIRVSNMTPFDTHNNSPESICSSTLGNSLSLANCNPSKTPHNSATWEVAISIFLRNPKES